MGISDIIGRAHWYTSTMLCIYSYWFFIIFWDCFKENAQFILFIEIKFVLLQYKLSPLVGKDQGPPSISRAYFLYSMAEQSKQRVIVYIDGFNFYYGLKKAPWKKYYWLAKEAKINVFIYFPPHQFSSNLATMGSGAPIQMLRYESKFKKALLPDNIKLSNGFDLSIPLEWKELQKGKK